MAIERFVEKKFKRLAISLQLEYICEKLQQRMATLMFFIIHTLTKTLDMHHTIHEEFGSVDSKTITLVPPYLSHNHAPH